MLELLFWFAGLIEMYRTAAALGEMKLFGKNLFSFSFEDFLQWICLHYK